MSWKKQLGYVLFDREVADLVADDQPVAGQHDHYPLHPGAPRRGLERVTQSIPVANSIW